MIAPPPLIGAYKSIMELESVRDRAMTILHPMIATALQDLEEVHLEMDRLSDELSRMQDQVRVMTIQVERLVNRFGHALSTLHKGASVRTANDVRK